MKIHAGFWSVEHQETLRLKNFETDAMVTPIPRIYPKPNQLDPVVLNIS